MLSRVANALYWMSRYLERAEHIARLLDVGFHLELDLSGMAAGPSEMHWSSLFAILQTKGSHPLNADERPATSIVRHLTFDIEDASSILFCVNRARNNARSVRGSLTPRMWRELNKLYFQLRDPEFEKLAHESPHDFYQTVQVGNHLFQGVCDATMNRDEGWQFIQLGKYLERADKTVRILLNKWQVLQDLTDAGNLPLFNLHWAAVLRSCMAYDAYQRMYISRIDPSRVVQFLLLQPRFPRSVRFSLERAAHALDQIIGVLPDDRETEADRHLGRLLSDLRFCEPARLPSDGMPPFLEMVLGRCNDVIQAVQGQYALR